MKSNTMNDFSNFLKYLPVFKKMGVSVYTKTDLKKIVSELLPESETDDGFKIFDPFIKENLDHTYGIDMKVLREILGDFFSEFLPGLMSEEAIKNYASVHFSDKTFVAINEVENSDQQSYKYLYDMLLKKHEELRDSFYGQKYELDNAYRDLAELHAEIKHLKENNGNMKNTTTDIVAFIKDFLTKDIIVQKVEAVDISGKPIICGSDSKKNQPVPDLSNRPGVYSFKRPSWFTPLREELELSKKNISRKNVTHTEDVLKDKVVFWKLLKKSKSKVEEKAQIVDETRKRNIEKLLVSDISNEEKYIKYMLLTPGMDKEYMKTLNGAAELGLSANTVIELLEQPENSFNREMIEAYVSQVHKATEYNMKHELAEELIRGEWYITSEINGSEQKYQLVPMERITEVANRLDHICKVFEEYEKLTTSNTCNEETMLTVQADNDLFDPVENAENDMINAYSDAALFEEPEMDGDRTEMHDPEEMEVLFVKQVESEFIKSSEEL